jgi:hypothetical protein
MSAMERLDYQTRETPQEELAHYELATTGALLVISECYDSGRLDTSKEIRAEYETMAQSLYKSYKGYQKEQYAGLTQFFGLNGDDKQENRLLTDSQLFQALADGAELEKEEKQEMENMGPLYDQRSTQLYTKFTESHKQLDSFFRMHRNIKDHELFQLLARGARIAEAQEPLPTKESNVQKIYVGTVGRMSSGKGLIGERLESYHFSTRPLSDVVRRIAAANEPYKPNNPIERGTLSRVSREIRQLFGQGVLISMTVKLSVEPKQDQVLLFDGLRNEHEVTELTAFEESGATVIIIDVTTGLPEQEDFEVRFTWSQARGDAKDGVTDPNARQKFSSVDKKEGPDIEKARALVPKGNHVINNPEKTKEEVFAQVDAILTREGISQLLTEEN